MTACVHPFDIPLSEPVELPLDAAPGPDGQDVAVGEVQGQEAEPEQQHVDGPEAHPEGGQEPDERGDDGEDLHARTVPARRPVDPVQLRRALTSWCDGLVAFDDRAVGLHQVLEAELALGEIEQELTDQLVEGMPVKDNGHRVTWVETPVGILKIDKRGGHSSWDAEAIWPEALKAARQRCADPDTGQVSQEAVRATAAMLDVVRLILGSPTFLVGGLQKIGVDPDEVRATAPKRKIVRFA